MVTNTIYYSFTTMGRIFSLTWIIKIISKVNLLMYLKRKKLKHGWASNIFKMSRRYSQKYDTSLAV
jgi:hypothetical protein